MAAFHASTTTGDDAPIPKVTRPGARSARVAAVMASTAGPRVYTGSTPAAMCSWGAHAAAAASGTMASNAPPSPVHTSP